MKKVLEPTVPLVEKSLDIFKKINLAEKRRALKTIRKAWQEGTVLNAVQEPIAGIGAETFCALYLLNRKQRPSKKRTLPDAGIQACTEATEIPS